MPADLPLNFCSDEDGAPLGVSSVLAITGLSPLIEMVVRPQCPHLSDPQAPPVLPPKGLPPRFLHSRLRLASLGALPSTTT